MHKFFSKFFLLKIVVSTFIILIITNNPLNSEAFYNIGCVHLRIDLIESAFGFFKQALELNDQDPDILVNIGVLEMLNGNNKEGAISLLKAARLGDKEALDTLKKLNKNV